MRVGAWQHDERIATGAVRLTGQRAVQVKNLFVTLDTNNDGSIDTKELRKGLKAFGYSLADAEVEQLMARMDLNQVRSSLCQRIMAH